MTPWGGRRPGKESARLGKRPFGWHGPRIRRDRSPWVPWWWIRLDRSSAKAGIVRAKRRDHPASSPARTSLMPKSMPSQLCGPGSTGITSLSPLWSRASSAPLPRPTPTSVTSCTRPEILYRRGSSVCPNSTLMSPGVFTSVSGSTWAHSRCGPVHCPKLLGRTSSFRSMAVTSMPSSPRISSSSRRPKTTIERRPSRDASSKRRCFRGTDLTSRTLSQLCGLRWKFHRTAADVRHRHLNGCPTCQATGDTGQRADQAAGRGSLHMVQMDGPSSGSVTSWTTSKPCRR